MSNSWICTGGGLVRSPIIPVWMTSRFHLHSSPPRNSQPQSEAARPPLHLNASHPTQRAFANHPNLLDLRGERARCCLRGLLVYGSDIGETSWVGRFPPTPHCFEVTYQSSKYPPMGEMGGGGIQGGNRRSPDPSPTYSFLSSLSLSSLRLGHSKDVLQRYAFPQHFFPLAPRALGGRLMRYVFPAFGR